MLLSREPLAMILLNLSEIQQLAGPKVIKLLLEIGGG